MSLETIKKRISERKSLEKRPDDNEDIAIKRYETYEKSTEPVIEYYKKLNLLKVIDGERLNRSNKQRNKRYYFPYIGLTLINNVIKYALEIKPFIIWLV